VPGAGKCKNRITAKESQSCCDRDTEVRSSMAVTPFRRVIDARWLCLEDRSRAIRDIAPGFLQAPLIAGRIHNALGRPARERLGRGEQSEQGCGAFQDLAHSPPAPDYAMVG
jgi:uncharacterized protein (UPF0262 family)